MTSEALLAFAITSLIIEVTPGPNMAYLATLSLASGRRAGLAAVAGIALGLTVSAAAAAIGFALFIQNSAVLYEALRWGGVAYLLYLGWEGWQQEKKDEHSEADSGDLPRTAFLRALIVNMLNPKAAIFYIAVLPEFVAPESGSVPQQTLVLSAIYVCIATIVHLAIVILAGSLQDKLNSPEKRRTTRRVLALALVGIAVWFAYSTSRGT